MPGNYPLSPISSTQHIRWGTTVLGGVGILGDRSFFATSIPTFCLGIFLILLALFLVARALRSYTRCACNGAIYGGLAAFWTLVGLGLLLFPEKAAIFLAISVSSLLFLSGLLRIWLGATSRLQHSTWAIVSGFISVCLAGLIACNWPFLSESLPWIFLASNLLSYGSSCCKLSTLTANDSLLTENARRGT